MTYKEILNCEERDGNRVFLYREGLFWKAYEQSAYRCVQGMHPFKVTKRFVKATGCEVVSIGFPIASLSKWADCFEMESESEDGKQCILVLKDLHVAVSFEEWKATLPSAETKTQVEEKKETRVSLLVERIRSFNLAESSPMDCLLFVNELKKMV